MRGVGRHEVSALLGRNDAAFSSRGEPNRVCGRDGVPAAPAGGRDSTPLPVQTLGFALLGDSLFSNAKKVSKNACPCIRPRLRRGSLAPMMFQGPAAKGHPCPIAALAASMPLNPLHITCARPPERGVRHRLIVRLPRNRQSVFVSLFANLQTPRTRSPFSNVGWKTAQHFPALTTAELLPNHADSIRPTNFIRPIKRDVSRFLLVRSHRNKQSALRPPLQNFQTTRSRIPVRRPSVIAVDGVERHGCRESCDGPGMALRSVPLERRWSEGTLRAAKGRMSGWPSFWLLFLGHTRKSDAPCKAQPVVPAKESAAPDKAVYAAIDHSKPLCSAKPIQTLRASHRTTKGVAAISTPTPPQNASRCPYSAGSGTPLRLNPEATNLPSRGKHP